MVRRVNSRRGEVDRSPSVMTSNTGTGRRGHSGGDPRGEPRGPEVDRSPSVMQSSGGLRERFVTPNYFFGNNWAAHLIISPKFEKQIFKNFLANQSIDFKFL